MSESRQVFHQGELAIQRRLGVAERVAQYAPRVIRDCMPDQHREFFAQLPFVLVGHRDAAGRVWASMLSGEPGFITSPSPQRLTISARPLSGDPLAHLFEQQAVKGQVLGLLGIELETRRRNRLNAAIGEYDGKTLQLEVVQSFGNCPQYIQTREHHFLDPLDMPAAEVETIDTLTPELAEWISNSDTFFVASSTPAAMEDGEAAGADVSHRGGRAGFVRVDDLQVLTIPDYAGNKHYNTLGNFMINPAAGLLFVDFEQGHLLSLSGRAELLWDSPEQEHFEGAERLWRFTVEEGVVMRNVLPLRWSFGEYSPNSLLTGTWQSAEARAEAERLRHSWVDYRVERRQMESEQICSFYLKPLAGSVPAFQPGQFITIRCQADDGEVIRTYSVSSAPHDPLLRISVKREGGSGVHPGGVMSNWLHDQLEEGVVVLLRAPTGDFTLSDSERPVVLLAAGVGITPLVSMARHALSEGTRHRSRRRLLMIHSFRNHRQRAFHDELQDLSDTSSGRITVHSVLTRPGDAAEQADDYLATGRIDRQLLQALLPLDDYEFYLCGPGGFMQDLYDLLRSMGVADERIFAEAFGPAGLRRDSQAADAEADQSQPPVAEQAVIEFADSGFEQAWQPEDGNLLDFAEAHGLSPSYSCRMGVCGSCKVKKLAGEVSYIRSISAPVAEDEVLLCCAQPARDEDSDITHLRLAL
ncbi:MAG: hypothetical protein Tsb002_33650 [Wenzhouxiangellaceae bacterium]